MKSYLRRSIIMALGIHAYPAWLCILYTHIIFIAFIFHKLEIAIIPTAPGARIPTCLPPSRPGIVSSICVIINHILYFFLVQLTNPHAWGAYRSETDCYMNMAYELWKRTIVTTRIFSIIFKINIDVFPNTSNT